MALTLGEAARRTGRAKSSLRRALNLGKIAGTKTASGEWEVDEASLLAAYPPPGDAPESRPGSSTGSERVDELVAVLRDGLAREREINRQLQGELERERGDRAADRQLFRELAEAWRRQLPPPEPREEPPLPEPQEPPRRPWWRWWR